MKSSQGTGLDCSTHTNSVAEIVQLSVTSLNFWRFSFVSLCSLCVMTGLVNVHLLLEGPISLGGEISCCTLRNIFDMLSNALNVFDVKKQSVL